MFFVKAQATATALIKTARVGVASRLVPKLPRQSGALASDLPDGNMKHALLPVGPFVLPLGCYSALALKSNFR